VQWVNNIEILHSIVYLSLKNIPMIGSDLFKLETFDAVTLPRYSIKFKAMLIPQKELKGEEPPQGKGAGFFAATGDHHP
jgi:hypothetical protein